MEAIEALQESLEMINAGRVGEHSWKELRQKIKDIDFELEPILEELDWYSKVDLADKLRVDFNIQLSNLKDDKLRVVDTEEHLELKNYIYISLCYLNQDMYEETLEYAEKALKMIPCQDAAI